MNDVERRVREAFDEVTLPAETRSRALQAIDKLAALEDVATPAPTLRAVASRLRWFKSAVGLAACLVLVALCFGGTRLYFDETAYVGIDINPSLELGINRFDIVVSANALNVDGEAVLSESSLSGKHYNEAIAELSTSEALKPYLQDDAYIEVSVTSADNRQADDLRMQSDTCLRELPYEGSSQVVDEGVHAEAKAAGIGVGRYRAALQLMKLDNSLTLEECAAMSMRELRNRIAEAGGVIDSGTHSGEDSCSNGQDSSQGIGGGQGMGNGQGMGQGMGGGQGREGSNGTGRNAEQGWRGGAGVPSEPSP